eukprot:TRINITY_DN22567_c0_g3_i7.p1 TRINITY_DN22567_c0_g3~~TRINITY_DN22567_c0_g3_i7.p1  ORF type:complete len:759 (-),score=116.55 TRINITY_DN22567_c0_g3_i7:89-2365(-)
MSGWRLCAATSAFTWWLLRRCAAAVMQGDAGMTSLEDHCTQDVGTGGSLVTSLCSCHSSRRRPSAVSLQERQRECIQLGYVWSEASFDSMRSYIAEVRPLVIQLLPNRTATHLTSFLTYLRTCYMCFAAECLGDDSSLRHVALTTIGAASLLPHLPPLLPEHYAFGQWHYSNMKPLLSPEGEASLRPSFWRLSETDHEKPLRAAFVTPRGSLRLGGAFYIKDAPEETPPSRIFREVIQGCLWKASFSDMFWLREQGRLMVDFWAAMTDSWGWAFAWKTDFLLLPKRREALQESGKPNPCEHMSFDWMSEYDVLILADHPSDAMFLPPRRESGPVRFVFSFEPDFLVRWLAGVDFSSANDTRPASERLEDYFLQQGICHVVGDPYDLQRVAALNLYYHTEDCVDSAARHDCKYRGLVGAKHRQLPRNHTDFAPLVAWPATFRWLLPELQAGAALQSTGSDPEASVAAEARPVVMLGRRTAKRTWTREKLEQRGFAVVEEGMSKRRGLGKRRFRDSIYKQPRSFKRSLVDQHWPELGRAKFLIYVCKDMSAGMLLQEAAALGVISIASPQKAAVRLLLPPELHVQDEKGAIAKIDELIAKAPAELAALQARIKGRAKRLLGLDAAPPLRALLQTFSKMALPPGGNWQRVAAAGHCDPTAAALKERHPTHRSLQTYWRFAAGRSCWQGRSEGRTTVSGGLEDCGSFCLAVSPECRIFVFNESDGSCEAFSSCRVSQDWGDHLYGVDIFVIGDTAAGRITFY